MPLQIGILPNGADKAALEMVRDAERLGVASVWTPEAWMYDALTPLGYLAAITEKHPPRPARSSSSVPAPPPCWPCRRWPCRRCPTAASSWEWARAGPRSWRGGTACASTKPVTRTSETIDIIRTITVRRATEPTTATVYTLPLPDSQGRALRSPVAGDAVTVPIHVAAMGPANLRLTGAKADGWIGTAFLPESADVPSSTPSARERPHRPDEAWTTWSSPWPSGWSSPTTSSRPAAATPPATPSPSAPWARPPRTSTTRPSPVRASATPSSRGPAGCGRRVTSEAAGEAVPDRDRPPHQPDRRRRLGVRTPPPLPRRRHHHPAGPGGGRLDRAARQARPIARPGQLGQRRSGGRGLTSR